MHVVGRARLGVSHLDQDHPIALYRWNPVANSQNQERHKCDESV